jgi:two-component system response regulator PilR (NtrC family)
MNKSIEGFSADALAALRRYSWPGNVRELENVVERAVALDSESHIQPSTLPDNLRVGKPATPRVGEVDPAAVDTAAGFNLERHLQDIERAHIVRALERSGGVQTQAAEELGLSFRQFRYLVKKYGLKKE